MGRARGSGDEPLRFLLIDEVSYIRGWDRAVKFLADAGAPDRTVLLLTGSDLHLIREARTFRARRGGPPAWTSASTP